MADTYRQVGDDSPGSITAANCKRQLSIKLKPSATYTIEGDRDELLAGRPDYGAVFETIETVDFYVVSMDLSDLDGGNSARLTIDAEAIYEDEPGEVDPDGPPQYGVKFQEVRLRIEEHPCCGTLTIGGAFTKLPTWDDWAKLTDSNWTEATDIPAFFETIGAWTREIYQDLKADGIDEFTMYYPIVTRLLTYRSRPNGVGKNSGRLQFPPTGALESSDNYDWLGGPDEIQLRSTKWERTTTWIACDEGHTSLYPPEV